VRVIDCTRDEVFNFKRWQDNSLNPETLPLDQTKVTRIKLRKFIRMGDGETRDKLEEQKREMISSAKRMFQRSQVDFEQVDDILGFKSRVASYLNGTPWWMKTRYYLCMSMCVVSPGCTDGCLIDQRKSPLLTLRRAFLLLKYRLV
jgi:hypothetical protein